MQAFHSIQVMSLANIVVDRSDKRSLIGEDTDSIVKEGMEPTILRRLC